MKKYMKLEMVIMKKNSVGHRIDFLILISVLKVKITLSLQYFHENPFSKSLEIQ